MKLFYFFLLMALVGCSHNENKREIARDHSNDDVFKFIRTVDIGNRSWVYTKNFLEREPESGLYKIKKTENFTTEELKKMYEGAYVQHGTNGFFGPSVKKLRTEFAFQDNVVSIKNFRWGTFQLEEGEYAYVKFKNEIDKNMTCTEYKEYGSDILKTSCFVFNGEDQPEIKKHMQSADVNLLYYLDPKINVSKLLNRTTFEVGLYNFESVKQALLQHIDFCKKDGFERDCRAARVHVKSDLLAQVWGNDKKNDLRKDEAKSKDTTIWYNSNWSNKDYKSFPFSVQDVSHPFQNEARTSVEFEAKVYNDGRITLRVLKLKFMYDYPFFEDYLREEIPLN